MRQVRNQRKHASPVTSFALRRFILYALPVRLHRMVYWNRLTGVYCIAPLGPLGEPHG